MIHEKLKIILPPIGGYPADTLILIGEYGLVVKGLTINIAPSEMGVVLTFPLDQVEISVQESNLNRYEAKSSTRKS